MSGTDERRAREITGVRVGAQQHGVDGRFLGPGEWVELLTDDGPVRFSAKMRWESRGDRDSYVTTEITFVVPYPVEIVPVNRQVSGRDTEG